MNRAPVLLLAPNDVAARRDVAQAPLAPLARSLAADLRPVIARELFVPAEKARMTRVGGRCPEDGVLLAFDPFSPRVHHCPACGRTYDDEAHYRWWIMWYQLWLAERAVHGAALALLAGDVEAGALSQRILEAYVDRYLTYPNRDNVLGPTRPFFSTYLESIWLLQLCVATDLLEAGDPRLTSTLGASVRDRIVEPSRALIAGYDEHASNRQVWNAAALAAAARLLGDDTAFERAVLGTSGVASHLRGGLLADGTWFEGENYHQFAHRGLWYGVTLAARAGLRIPSDLVDRFDRGFVAPFLTALPDLTLPARRDSQWAISLRQWRWAEWCELALARHDAPELAGALAALYADDAGVPRRDSGRWRSAAESERNELPTSLTRADLGWKSLLYARAEEPTGERWAPSSVLLEGQGIAVFRRDRGALWVALDYGTSGGGHGHPDRLNLLLADGPRRWLDDMGTGSYVARTLHWYRSTLAHNAPLVDGRSQERVDGRLLAHEERGDWGWVRAAAELQPSVHVERTVVVGPGYVVERLTWRADRDVTIDLPFHVDAEVAQAVWRPATVEHAGGLEDGFDFLREVVASPLGTSRAARLHVDESRAILANSDAPTAEAAPCRAWVACSDTATWYRATAPSSPGRGERPFLFLRATGARGWACSVWDTRASLARVSIEPHVIIVERVTGEVDEHRTHDDVWTVREQRDRGHQSVHLRGVRSAAVHATVSPPAAGSLDRIDLVLRRNVPVELELGEPHYRPSEQSWRDAGRPHGTVRVVWDDDALAIDVHVVTPHPSFVPAGRENPLDNERPEVNGDGVQLHVQPTTPLGTDTPLGWLLVPDASRGDDVRVLPLDPPSARSHPDARWARTDDGYRIAIRLPTAVLGDASRGAPFGLDLIVNETAPDRERRRGQLVLSGARGEFVYLQGDRHEPSRYLRVRLVE